MKSCRLQSLFFVGAMVAVGLFLVSRSDQKTSGTDQSANRPDNPPAAETQLAALTPVSNQQPATAQTHTASPARSDVTAASKRPAVPARLVIGSAWKKEGDPQLSAFSAWTDRYLQAAETDRPKLLVEGSELARQRRDALAQLIREDPELALAAAVPLAVRERLPAGITALLEDRVSGRGELSLNAAVPVPGNAGAETMFYSALINRKAYRAFTYGRRAMHATAAQASIIGIAVDKSLAVLDSPLRMLEPGETPGERPIENLCISPGNNASVTSDTPLNLTTPTAVEANGHVLLFCNPEQVPPYESQLEAAEYPNEVNAADGLPGTSGVVGRPTAAWASGTKKVLIIRVDFPDLTGTPVNPADSQTITEDYAVNLIDTAGGVRDFYEQSSYGKTTVQISPTVGGDSPDVTPLLRMPENSTFYATNADNGNDLLHQAAREAALNAGFPISSYDRVGVIFQNLGAIPGSQITYAGLGNVIGINFWINGYYEFNVVAHEIGHNYGLNHAKLWKVSDGNPVSPNGTNMDYGDVFDVMGGGNFFQNQFSPWHKSILQWLPDSAVATITNGGTYRVYRFDDPGVDLANTLALKIARESTHDYWISYRRATGNASLNNGAYVQWGYNNNQASDLLDMTTPGNNVNDAGLAVGATFNDTAAGITLHPVAQGGSGVDLWLDMQVTFQPRIQWAKTTVYADEAGGVATLTLTRNNNSVGAVSVHFTTTSGTATAPADFTATNGTISWPDGDASPRIISIPVVSDGAPEGTEQFAVILSSPSGGVIVDNPTATVFITEPGTFDPEFAPGFPTEFVNSAVKRILVMPDGKIVVGGYFTSVYTAHAPKSRLGIARLNANGTLDLSFPSGGGQDTGNSGGGVTGFSPSQPQSFVADLAAQPDGKIVIGGNFTSVFGSPRNFVARLNPDGSLDTSFNPGTGANDVVNAVLVQPDGKILVGGDFTSFNGVPHEYVARLNPDGSLDTDFATTPPLDFGDSGGWSVQALALQPDRKLLVGGVFYFSGGPNLKAGICRLTTNGVLDTTFNGVVQGAHELNDPFTLDRIFRVVPQLDGKILIAGQFTAYNNTARGGIARLTSTGALDPAFAPTTDGDGDALFIQPDGKILFGGSFSTVNGSAAHHFARLVTNGVLDSTFAAANGPAAEVFDFALQPDGRVVFGGDFGAFQSHTNAVGRFFSGLSALPGTIQWTTDAAIGVEGTNAILTATRTGGNAGALSVNFATVANTATSADFVGTNGTLSWANGDATAKTISIPITADALVEGVESFNVNLGSPLMESTLLGVVQQATVNIYTRYGAWQATNFTTLELVNPLISGDAADPDGDGVKNVLEYAFGLSPNTPDTSGLPSGTLQNVTGTNYLALTFRRLVPQLDLTYTPRAAGSLLGPWNSGLIQVGSPVNNGDGTETVTFRDTVPVPSTSQRFLRVEVSRTP